MSQIGVSDFKYAVLLKDDKEGVSYGEWNAIPGLVSVDIKSSGSVSTNYADNGPFETASNLGDITVAIEQAELPDKDRAALLGHKLGANGEMIYSSDDVAPYVAVMMKGKNADGTAKHVKLLKMKFSEPADSFVTEKGSVDFKNFSVEGKASCRLYDHQWKRTLDERNTGVTDEGIAAFIASVE